MSCLEILTLTVSVAKDFVVLVVSIVGAWVAVSGLSTWKRQLKGQTEYALARRLLTGVLRVRNRLRDVRNQPPFYPAEKGEHGPFEGMRKAFGQRLQAVDEAWVELETDLLEAEALWGYTAGQMISKLRQCHGKLAAGIVEYLWVENPTPQPWVTVDRSAERVDRLRQVVFLLGPEKDDVYSGALRDAVEEAMGYLRPHLKP